ncbi:hypothetical protein LOC72_06445 [Roseiconus lacunae]|nr:hypothetical protein [Roseiconus lacunae]
MSPFPNETEEDFVVRAHRELLPSVPEPMQRNRIVWDAWDASNGNSERERAASIFTAEKFDTKQDVCLWIEHESNAVGPDGQTVVKKNDVNRLSAIIRENNHRIKDTDFFSAIIDKHTLNPSEDDKGKEKPKTLGYTGPYRLGMIGRVQPKFAIFGDEHHRKDRADVLSDRPRRSVEIVTLRANNRPYIDAVAAISEAPRLPLPVQYSAQSDDDFCVVERFQAEAVPAFPGGGNTYTPGADPRRKREAFGAMFPDANSDQPDQSETQMSQGMLKQIVDAISQTPQFQFINQLMQQQNAPANQDPNASPMAPASPAGPAGPAMGSQYSMANQYSVDPAATDREATEEGITREQYQALVDSNKSMMERMKAISEQNAYLAAQAADADRKSRLSELYQTYPHIVDLDAEMNRCLYSNGSEMNDDQFENHFEVIETYAAKTPISNQMIPNGEMPSRPVVKDPVERERFEAKVHERSLEIFEAKSAAGEIVTPDACWAEAEKELQSA